MTASGGPGSPPCAPAIEHQVLWLQQKLKEEEEEERKKKKRSE